MNELSISPIVVEHLGWVLVHSLWQFALIGLLAAVTVHLLRRSSAATRYVVLGVAMVVTAVAPVMTWTLQPVSAPESPPLQAVLALESEHDLNAANSLAADSFPFDDQPMQTPEIHGVGPAIAVAPSNVPAEIPPTMVPVPPSDVRIEPSWSERITMFLRPWLAWIVAGWSIGVVLCSLRPLLGWHTLRRLRRVGVSPVSDDVLAALRRVSQRLGMPGAVRVLHSTLAQVPVVVGYMRPIILLPVSLVTSIPASQLEAILAHELAHVRRHDFLVNLLQTLVETLFFYHPAVWWLSSRLRAEREHCCDDLVVAALGNRIEYGRALLAIEELRGRSSVLALGASDGRLLPRVRRIVGLQSDSASRSPWPALSLVVCGVAAVCVMSVLSWRGLAESPSDATPPLPARHVAALVNVETPANPGEWPMWGGSPRRNHVASGRLPTEWDLQTGRNVLWKAPLGTQTYSSPVVSGGRVFIGTNNGAGLDPRRPAEQDLSCLVCLDQTTGKLLWQYASEKMPAGTVSDWPWIGLCSTACVEGNRLWVVTNRCEVVCLDTDGFRDGENDGEFTTETDRTDLDADVVWKFDMFNTLGVRPLHQAASSIAVVDGVVLLNTLNGPDESRQNVPAPKAPNFLALDARTGRVVWQDNSAGESIIAGGNACSWSGTSPAVATIGGVAQAIFAGREGWLYGFDFADLKQGKTTRLWQFDCNPKTSKYFTGGQFARNTLVASPVVVGDRVFIATGRNPEGGDGEGAGDLWCIDATKRGDISSEQVFNNSHRYGQEPIPHKPLCACDPKEGDFTRPNLNSGAVWHYAGTDRNGDGELAFDETFHCSLSSPTIHDGLLFIPDYTGLLHCVDARTGEGLWTHDLLASVWSSCVIADGKVLIGDEDGNLTIFKAARTCQPVHGDDPPNFGTSIYSTPVVAKGTLLVATRDSLVAIHENDQREANAQVDASQDDAQAARAHQGEAVGTINLTPPAPPKGLEFLAPYPKLHGLSLDMTEPQFLEIVKQQELKTRKTVDGERVTHHIALGDDHTLIVMFDKDAKCSGIQRVRGEDDSGTPSERAGRGSPDPALDPTAGLPNSDEDTKPTNNANGDLRSNPAAGPGDTRRAQDKSNTDELSVRQQVDSIADRFAATVRRKAEFLDDEQVDALRNELRDYLLERVTRPVSEEWQTQVLRAVELFVVDVHRRPFEGPTRFMIDFETLKWHLWTALDRDELSAEQLALRESQRKWFREFARTLPDPSGGKIGTWQHQDGSKSEMTTLEFKLKDLDEMMADPLNPYFAWPFAEDQFRNIQIGVRDQKWVVGKMDLNGACNIVFHPVALQQGTRVSKRWPIENGAAVFDGFGKNQFRWDRDLAARPLSALKKTRAGRESPDPALDPTAGLPNSDEETNPPKNANGDRRSNPAATSEDPRRAQLTIKYEMPGAEAETRIFVEREDKEFHAKHGRRDEYGKDEYGGVRFSRLKNGDSLTLTDLPAGKFQVARYRLVEIVREGTSTAQASVYLDRQWIELAEQETKSISLSRPAGQPVSGRVVIPADLKINTLVVHVCSENARSSGSLNHRDVRHFDALNADADGRFKTELLPPGRYKVIVEGYANHSLALSGIIVPSWEGSAQVTVTESNEPAAIEVTLHKFDLDAWLKDQTIAANELEFLKPYPKLHGLSLDMTEPQFLEIGKQQELKTRKTVDGEKVTHHIALGDGHTLFVTFDINGKCSGIQRIRGDAATADPNNEIASGLLPGFFGGAAQRMQIGADGSISYSDAKGLCQMKLFDDDRLQIAFHNDNQIWTDVTLTLVTGATGQRRAVWSAEINGYAYQATAIPFSTRGCLYRLEKRLDGKLIHGSQQFFAVTSRQANAEPDEPAAPIDHRDWRVDQSGTGVVAGSYTGASQVMQIADDGTISNTDQPLGICHLAVLEDDRLTATFRDARGMPVEVTLPLVTTAAENRASWSAEIDGHTLRATAVPYSDTVYVFSLEILRDGKLIEGEQQFYAIDQKLRKATPEERVQAESDSNG